MSPTEIIERATEEGVLLALSPSGNISAIGDQSAIDRWLPTIRQSKAVIIAELQCAADEPDADDALEFYQERAAIAEFDGGLSRPEAEAQAWRQMVVKFQLKDSHGDPMDTVSMQMPRPGQTTEDLKASLVREFGERIVLESERVLTGELLLKETPSEGLLRAVQQLVGRERDGAA